MSIMSDGWPGKISAFFERKDATGFLILGLLAAGGAQAREHGAIVALTTEPGSALETTAKQLVAGDLKQSAGSGDTPVLLVGSAKLSAHGARALFVQVQSAAFCGSSGCSTSVYVKRGGGWSKVMDSISGPIKVSPRSHHGMRDLLLHGGDRWVWNGSAYIDTLPTPDIDLRHSTKG
jgi:hypothetical protein